MAQQFFEEIVVLADRLGLLSNKLSRWTARDPRLLLLEATANPIPRAFVDAAPRERRAAGIRSANPILLRA
jgi:hypothetical protein